MKNFVYLAAAALMALAAAGTVSAQSSGNFNYASTGNNFTGCTLSSAGAISGGHQCVSSCTIDAAGVSTCVPQSGQCGGNAVAAIKTSSGSGNVFIVRPSAVVGLLTDVTVSSKQSGSSTGSVSSSALAGVNFQVSVTGPGAPQVIPSAAVTYDSRYIQISTNLFQALSTQCLAITGGCSLSFNESTASAHSFDFIVTNLQSGTYTVTTTWADSLGGTGISNSLACVGPLNMTIQQNKMFHMSTPGTVTPTTTL